MDNGLTKQELQRKYHQDIMAKLKAIQSSFDEMIERTDQRLVSFLESAPDMNISRHRDSKTHA